MSLNMMSSDEETKRRKLSDQESESDSQTLSCSY